MDILRSLLEHDAGRRSEQGENGKGNVVHWGGSSLVTAAQKKRFETVRFLYENTPRDVYEETLDMTIRFVLDAEEMNLVEELLPTGTSAADYGEISPNPSVIELTFDAGLLDEEFAAALALRNLVPSGRLDLMKKIWQKHGQLTEIDDWMRNWVEAMATACQMGDLAILQWMVEHTSGRAAIEDLKQYKVVPLLYHTVCENQLNVVQYLHDQDAAVDYGNALLGAIRTDNMDAVKWLVEHFPPSEKIPEYCILVEAARYGRVGMLQYFQNLEELNVPGFPGSSAFSIPEARADFSFEVTMAEANTSSKERLIPTTPSGWQPTDAMDDAAANGQLDAVQWLHANRSEGCTTRAMDEVAGNGHLEVVKWLHANRSEGCSTNAMDGAAAYGQLEMLEWLHANRSEGHSHFGISLAGHNNHIEVLKWLVSRSPKKLKDAVMDSAAYRGDLALVQWLHTKMKARCTVPVMISAARFGRLEVLKYLSSHRPKTLARESCVTLTQEALVKNHFRVAHWCLTHLPAHSPKPIEMSVSIRFETLLFVRFHYPEMFTPAYPREDGVSRSVQVREEVDRHPRVVMDPRVSHLLGYDYSIFVFL